MAAQGARASYQYETSPRKLQPDYEPRKNPYKKKKSSLKNNNKVNQRKRVVKRSN